MIIQKGKRWWKPVSMLSNILVAFLLIPSTNTTTPTSNTTCHETCATCTGENESDCLTCRGTLTLDNSKCSSLCLRHNPGTYQSGILCFDCNAMCKDNCSGPAVEDCFEILSSTSTSTTATSTTHEAATVPLPTYGSPDEEALKWRNYATVVSILTEVMYGNNNTTATSTTTLSIKLSLL